MKKPKKACKKCGVELTLQELYDLDGFCFLCSDRVSKSDRKISKALRREKIN